MSISGTKLTVTKVVNYVTSVAYKRWNKRTIEQQKMELSDAGEVVVDPSKTEKVCVFVIGCACILLTMTRRSTT